MFLENTEQLMIHKSLLVPCTQSISSIKCLLILLSPNNSAALIFPPNIGAISTFSSNL